MLTGGKGSEAKGVLAVWVDGNIGLGKGPSRRSWLQPHRFFRGSAPRTCRTAVLSSGCTETGRGSHQIRPPDKPGGGLAAAPRPSSQHRALPTD